MSKKIAIIGAGQAKTALLIQSMKEKFGDDVVLMTAEEIKESGVDVNDIANIPTMKITASPIMEMRQTVSLSGQEQRRKRRKEERKQNKTKK